MHGSMDVWGSVNPLCVLISILYVLDSWMPTPICWQGCTCMASEHDRYVRKFMYTANMICGQGKASNYNNDGLLL
jgi:hypothetical protein